MGQVNVKISDEKERQLDKAAASYGMQRADFVRKVFDEVILANESGGVAFSQGDGQRVDLKASELLREVNELLVESERSRRENLMLGERLLKASNGGEEAVRDAQQRLTEQIVAQRKASDFPFRKEIEDLKADVGALPGAIGGQIETQLQPLAELLATIETAAREPRFTRNLVIGREFIHEWQVIAWMAAGFITVGVSALFIAGNLVPGFGRAMADRFVSTDTEVCRMIDDRYSNDDCAVPDLKRRAAIINLKMAERQ